MTTLKILLIDDLRFFRDLRNATVARTSAAALTILTSEPEFEWDEIWLDHDLGLLPEGWPDTIMRVVDYFCEQAFNNFPVKVGVIKIHTSNPVGAKQMITSLERFGYEVQRVQAEIYFTV
jgi:hypothetical protein